MPEEPEVQETEGSEKLESKSFDESYVKELRSEAAKYRTERNELRKQVESLAAKDKEREDAGKSEVEKLASENTALKKSIEDMQKSMEARERKAQIISEAAKMNVVDAEAVYRLLDLDDIDDDPNALKKALTSLLKEKPYLVKEDGPPSPGAGGPPVKGGKKSTDEQLVDLLKAGAQKNRLL